MDNLHDISWMTFGGSVFGSFRDSNLSDLHRFVMMTHHNPGMNNIVKILINLYPNSLNHKSSNGHTPLMLACKYANKFSSFETVRLLVEAGADIDIRNKAGYSAIMIAAENTGEYSNIQVVQYLIERRANCKFLNDSGQNIVHIIAMNLDTKSTVQTFKLFLGGNYDLNTKDSNGNTILMGVLEKLKTDRSISVVKTLLEHGANANIDNLNNETSLMFAIRYTNPQYTTIIAQLLLAHRARLNTVDSSHMTALNYAIRRAADSGDNPGDKDAIRLLVNAGADLNLCSQGCDPSISFAVKSYIKNDEAMMDILYYLYKNGARLYDAYQAMIAATRVSFKVFRYLITDLDANVNAQDYSTGNTILMYLITTDISLKIDMIKALVNHGCNIYAKNNDGKTAYQMIPRSESNIKNYFKGLVFDSNVKTAVHTGDDICSICFEVEHIDCKLRCGHYFHSDCVKTWLYEKKTCPVCRAGTKYIFNSL